MPSPTHQSLIDVFNKQPRLAPELLRRALGVKLPAGTELRIGDSTFKQTATPDYHADLVILLGGKRPKAGIIFDIQLALKKQKRRSWPLYVASLHAREGCPVYLVVLTLSARVARWASQPMLMGPGCQVVAHVLGPDVMPIIDDLRAARKEPEIAVLSAVAHGKSRDPARAARVALAALGACLRLDTELVTLYGDLVFDALGKAARRELEALMRTPEHRPFQSEFARKYTALGEARGKAEGKAEIMRTLLAERFGKISKEVEKRILTSTSAQMDTWTKRLLSANSLDEVFRSGARTGARTRRPVGTRAAPRPRPAPKRRQR